MIEDVIDSESLFIFLKESFVFVIKILIVDLCCILRDIIAVNRQHAVSLLPGKMFRNQIKSIDEVGGMSFDVLDDICRSFSRALREQDVDVISHSTNGDARATQRM